MLTISVAMATYNGARYLREQLDSLARQTLLPHELVVSDDGSTDETLAIVRDFAANAPFAIRILDKTERLGFADNFLHAAEACAGDLIAFCDQDDVWLPEKLEVVARRIEQDDSLLALHTLQATDDTLVPLHRHTQRIDGDRVHPPLELEPYVSVWGNSMVFRRDLVALIPRADRPRQPEADGRLLSHDHWIHGLAGGLGRVSHIEQPLILYRQHDANAFGLRIGKSRRERWGDQLRSWTKPPINEMMERQTFYGHLAVLFRLLSERPGHRYAKSALDAANHYAKRRADMVTRTDVFTAPRLRQRIDAFRRIGASAGGGRRRTMGRIREIVLGVSGLSTLSPQLTSGSRYSSKS